VPDEGFRVQCKKSLLSADTRTVESPGPEHIHNNNDMEGEAP
jgi:hypothetical protein